MIFWMLYNKYYSAQLVNIQHFLSCSPFLYSYSCYNNYRLLCELLQWNQSYQLTKTFFGENGLIRHKSYIQGVTINYASITVWRYVRVHARSENINNGMRIIHELATRLCRPQLTQLLSRMDIRVLFLAISILSLHYQSVLPTDKPVYFSLIVSYGEYGYNSSGGIPAINIALEQIRAKKILPGYNLTYEVERNSKVAHIHNIYTCYYHSNHILYSVLEQNHWMHSSKKFMPVLYLK